MKTDICQLGETALRLDGDPLQMRRLALHLQAAGYRFVLGVGNLTVRYDPLRQDAAQLRDWLAQTLATCTTESLSPGRLWRFPVIYGGENGPDLARVAAHCRLSPSDVAKQHSAVRYQVECIGFLPGFPYLSGLPAALSCPRLDTPRLVVPAGSVGIGGSQTGVYPLASPGGWNLIGHCATTLFDPQADPPALLAPGDAIEFVAEAILPC